MERKLEFLNDKRVVELIKEKKVYPAFGRVLREAIFMLENSFGSDNYRILVNTNSNYRSVAVAIKFKELVIVNSNDTKHIIRDLYVTFTMQGRGDGDRISIVYVGGLRGTVTNKELTTGYAHSHLGNITYSGAPYIVLLSVDNYFQTNTFCLGRSELSKIISIINGNTWDANVFRYFLYHLDNYVRWESLEGGPYIKMSTIGNRRRRTVNVDVSLSDQDEEIKKIISETLKGEHFNIEIIEGVPKVCDDEKFMQYLKNVLPLRYFVEHLNGAYYSINTMINDGNNTSYALHDNEYHIPMAWNDINEDMKLRVIPEKSIEEPNYSNIVIRRGAVKTALKYANIELQHFLIYEYN